MDIRLGDIVKMKKSHPCGCDSFVVARVGMDFKLTCQKCGHTVMLPRLKAEKNIRQVMRTATEQPQSEKETDNA